MELYVAEPTPVRHITPEQESYNGNSSPASSRYNRINRPNLSVPHDKALWECIKKNQSRHVNHSFIGPQTNASKSLLRDVCCDEFDALGFVWLFGCLAVWLFVHAANTIGFNRINIGTPASSLVHSDGYCDQRVVYRPDFVQLECLSTCHYGCIEHEYRVNFVRAPCCRYIFTYRRPAC